MILCSCRYIVDGYACTSVTVHCDMFDNMVYQGPLSCVYSTARTLTYESHGGVPSVQRMPAKLPIGVPFTEGQAQEPDGEVMPELIGLEGPGAQASIV